MVCKADPEGIMSVAEISRIQKIPRKTLYRWLRSYEKEGEIGIFNFTKTNTENLQ